ncbi:hypothetical protein [Nocardioides soli]|uniref:Uncharacterized protein n=1 Tax=Nocardioides soli TaxID=1036020 RepID=A0A7W4W233_9ACTN|nr:hypothetical protein [Nocardioides soli]MBB3045733.1 hypothetical protein [Nocardioides soli]
MGSDRHLCRQVRYDWRLPRHAADLHEYPITGGIVAGATGMRSVFICTAGVLFSAAMLNLVATRRINSRATA